MEFFIIIGLILLNGVLAMSEIAMVSARKSRLETEAKTGNKSARRALKLANEPDRFLSTVQIGITLIGILTGLYSGQALAGDLAVWVEKIEALQPHALLISKTIIVIVVTYLTLIFGELVPKRIGMVAAERMAKIIAAPMDILSRIASPFVWLLSASTSFMMRVLGLNKTGSNKITEEEIKAIIQESTAEGEIQEVEQDIVERVFNLGDRDIASIMTHRSDLVWLNITDSNDRIREIVKTNLHTIYPVSDTKLDNIVGVVFLKDLFGKIDAPDFNLKALVRPPQYFPQNQSVYNALEHLKQGHLKYGLVTDEFGSIEGIVTLKDIVKALIGDVPEIGEEPDIVQRDNGTFLVDGQCPFYDFLAYFDMEFLYTNHYYNTLSGLILKILEHIPRTGEKLVWYNFEFEIVDMDGARIDKVLVKINKE
ncbi:hemolysin family protein [Butyricimonas hominis]|uniref:HlyC/CorC family transporter n=1 Tax=Butyricimonas hominis TaxID=2763032 RepID=A0ABR7D2G0_9BACT|nr:hemolysin family protein [Butyricimonas hominis]MBC5622130.1 HlyC/CorC family transporter [Butyricimonas hominis]